MPYWINEFHHLIAAMVLSNEANEGKSIASRDATIDDSPLAVRERLNLDVFGGSCLQTAGYHQEIPFSCLQVTLVKEAVSCQDRSRESTMNGICCSLLE